MRYGSLWIAIVAAGAVACTGCGGSTKVYPVKGTVKFEGKPMKGGGSITFQPTGSQPGKTGGGEIKEDGTYELMTNAPGDGSMPGDFRVVITQTTEREPSRTKDGERAGKSVSVVGEADRIPLIYADPTKSPLTAKVEAKDNVIDFDLKREAAPPGNKGAMRGLDPLRGPFAAMGWSLVPTE
jgi:hypothetical protein